MQQTNINVNAITPEMLACLLLNICQPDTQIISQSTAILKKYFELPTSIIPLMKHLTTHQDLRVRLLSCICLKKRLIQHWETQDPTIQNEIKVALLLAYNNETAPKVKENIAYLIGLIFVLMAASNLWPELISLVQEKCNSEKMLEKEAGMMLMLAISEGLGNLIEKYLAPFVEIIKQQLIVPNPAVQIFAVKTINCITKSNITNEALNKIGPLIMTMVNVVLNLPDNEGILQEVFDNLTDLIDLPKFLNSQLNPLLTAACSVAGNKKMSLDLRKVAFTFIQSAVDTKAKMIKKSKDILVKILQMSFEVATESEEGYDDDEETSVDSALDMLEQYALKIPNTIIYPLIMSGCESYLKSNEASKRKAALLIIGTVSKGVEDYIKNNLESVLSVVLQCFSDPDQEVQEATVIALCYFADNLSPEIVEHHSKILPKLLEAVQSKSEKVRTRVFYAIQTFCENLSEKEIIPYMPPLLQSLVGYFDSPNM
jgi:hypothetical protein